MIFLTHILLSIILLFLAVVVVLFLVFVLDSLILGHDLPTSRRATRALAAAIQKHKTEAKIFYDLGCAHGSLSLRLKKILPSLEIRGIDDSGVRIFFAKLKNKILRRKVDFRKQSIFEADLRDADAVYAYLWYDLMPVLEKKLRQELRQNSVVITNTSRFHNWQPAEEVITYPGISKTPDFETLFIYVKK